MASSSWCSHKGCCRCVFPLHDACGRSWRRLSPVETNSSFCCDELRRLVGGVFTTRHTPFVSHHPTLTPLLRTVKLSPMVVMCPRLDNGEYPGLFASKLLYSHSFTTVRVSHRFARRFARICAARALFHRRPRQQHVHGSAPQSCPPPFSRWGARGIAEQLASHRRPRRWLIHGSSAGGVPRRSKRPYHTPP